MNKKNALILTIVAVLCFGIFLIGIIDSVGCSQYQDLAFNLPVVILLGLGFIGCGSNGHRWKENETGEMTGGR